MASTPVTQSLLGRIISALTPVSSRDILSACETGTPANSSQRYETPSRRGKYISDSQSQSVVSLLSRKRKRRDQENCDPESNAIEMKEILNIPEKRLCPSSSFSPNSYPIFSPSLSIPASFCFPTDSCGGSVVCETLSSKLVGSPMAESEVSSPVVRRSERVAQRKRGCGASTAGLKSKPFPISFLSPVSLHQYVKSLCVLSSFSSEP